MENLRALIDELRGLYTQVRNDRFNNRPVERVQTVIRNKVKEQLSRTDLRVPVEAALTEILHDFDGFDSSDEESQELVLIETEKLLNRIESLIETENAINADRGPLPEPPPVTAEIVAQEMRQIEQEEARKRRREHEARQPKPVEEERPRRDQPPGREPREQRDGRGHGNQRRPRPARPEGERGPRPPQEGPPPAPAQGGPERSDLKFQKDPPSGGDSGGSRRRRRGRRRP